MIDAQIVIAAAMLPEHPGVMECLQYQVVGLIVVMVALTMLWLICELAGTAFRSAKVREVRSLGGGDVFDDEAEESVMQAVVMAAAHATLGPGHRIVSAAPAPAVSAEATAAVAATAASAAKEDEVMTEAAVVSAVHAALGPGHRVVSVQACPQGSGAMWSAEGRRQHFQSHKVR